MKLNQLLTLLVLIAAFCYTESANLPRRVGQKSPIKKFNKNVVKTTTTTITDKKLSIVGGMAANPGQFPYVVYIDFMGEADSWFCTGVLIYYNYVITTANCIYGAIDIAVLLGEYDYSASMPVDRSRSRVRIFARQWTFHESYNLDYTYDIGIIQLPLYAVANLNITTIAMSLTNVLNTHVGKTATIAGWGAQSSSTYPNHLLWTTLNIVNTATCQVDWPDVTSDTFCAAPPTTSVYQGGCFGDEGAPLVYLGLLLGIANTYDYEECSAYATVFTPIAAYYNWIISKTTQAVLNFWTVPVIIT